MFKREGEIFLRSECRTCKNGCNILYKLLIKQEKIQAKIPKKLYTLIEGEQD